VIDDGSTDDMAAVARACGVDHVVRHVRTKGLARSFRTGLDACLRLGASVTVNTDGDNQYVGADIPARIAPILVGQADMVVGDRRTDDVARFSPLKKRLQRVGGRVVRRLSDTDTADVVSGFWAFSRDAALTMNIVSTFSYTIETTAGQPQARRAGLTRGSVGA